MFTSSIVLIGMPGSGKTTVGQMLAELLDMRFHDSDVQIAKTLGMSIPEIIAQKGEAYFRHNETLACSTLLQHSEGVIALGANAVFTPEIARLLSLHTVVYLINGEQHEHYQRIANHVINVNNRPPITVVRSIMDMVGITEEVC